MQFLNKIFIQQSHIFSLFEGEEIKDIFGTGLKKAPYADRSVGSGVSTLFRFSIDMIFFAAALTVLIYLMWGAFNFITSGQEPDKVKEARGKIVGALFGAIILVIALTLWLVVSRNILGVVGKDGIFKIPTLRESIAPTNIPGTKRNPPLTPI